MSNTSKIELYWIAVEQQARAQKAFDEGDWDSARILFRLATETETKANSLK